MNLVGKSVFITGGARGIGLAIAQACKKQGANVTIVSRTQADLDSATQVLSQINSIPSLAVACDVKNKESLREALFVSHRAFGPIYGVVAAAGIYGPIGSFVDSSFNDWSDAIDINLKGTALTVHEAFPYLKDPKGGRVILFSGGGQGPFENFSSYATAKGAIWRFTETVGAELSRRNVFMNAIAPGAVNTKFLDEILAAGPIKVGQKFYDKSVEQKKSGGQCADKAAELCIFLLSAESKGLWGKTLSAIWDPLEQIKDAAVNCESEIFTYRRVVDKIGGTHPK